LNSELNRNKKEKERRKMQDILRLYIISFFEDVVDPIDDFQDECDCELFTEPQDKE
jgi:hypothetical protein